MTRPDTAAALLAWAFGRAGLPLSDDCIAWLFEYAAEGVTLQGEPRAEVLALEEGREILRGVVAKIRRNAPEFFKEDPTPETLRLFSISPLMTGPLLGTRGDPPDEDGEGSSKMC